MPTREQSHRYYLNWRAKNPDAYQRGIEKTKQYRKRRRETDPIFRTKENAKAAAYWHENKDAIKHRRKDDPNRLEKARRYNNTAVRRRAIRDHKMRTIYGISLDEYERLEKEQGGVCAICSMRPAVKDRWRSGKNSLYVDHNHTTGAVRGLLCFHCNTGLGHFRDDPTLLAKANSYLDLTAHGS